MRSFFNVVKEYERDDTTANVFALVGLFRNN